MIQKFLSLEWKQFFRSSNWQKSVLINILMVFFALYFMAIFLIGGFFLYEIISKIYPDQDVLTVVNGLLFYWFVTDLLMRFFFQKLPVMSVKPLLTLPIKRRAVVNYVLRKSMFSFFNFLPLFGAIPFAVKLVNKGYESSTVLIWLAAVIVITLIINFFNFILESFSSDLELPFLPLMAFAGTVFALNYFDIISFTDVIGSAFNALLDQPIWLALLLGLLGFLYVSNFKLLKQKLYIDSTLKVKQETARSTNLEWTKRFGDIAPFMQLDIKLLTRNKRTKSSLWMLGLGLLYGLFFYPNPIYADLDWFFVFIGIFVTGIFLINFGQFIPAWDSAYYKLLMSQNIKYEKYLKSKFTLMVLSVVIMFVLSIPYVYFGWKILLAHFAAAIYNIGVNSHVILWGGAYNRKRIELDQRAAFNFQGTGAVQWLIGIPLMLVPMIIFAILNWLIGFNIAVLIIILLGISGVVFHQKIMNFIVGKYQDSKHKMIDAFSQTS